MTCYLFHLCSSLPRYTCLITSPLHLDTSLPSFPSPSRSLLMLYHFLTFRPSSFLAFTVSFFTISSIRPSILPSHLPTFPLPSSYPVRISFILSLASISSVNPCIQLFLTPSLLFFPLLNHYLSLIFRICPSSIHTSSLHSPVLTLTFPSHLPTFPHSLHPSIW